MRPLPDDSNPYASWLGNKPKVGACTNMINLAKPYYLPIIVILALFLGIPLTIINLYEKRYEITRTDDLKTGDYEPVPNIFKYYRRRFEAFKYIFKYTEYVYDFFISYKCFTYRNNSKNH